MLKSKEGFFSSAQKGADFLIVFLCWISVYYLRFYFLPKAQHGQDFVFFRAGLVLAVLTLYFFSRQGLYKSHRLSSRYEEMQNVFQAHTYTVLSFVVLLYFMSENRLSRAVIFSYYLTACFVLICYRVSVRNILRAARRRGLNLRHVVLIGKGAAIERYVQNINKFPDSGISFARWIDSGGLNEKYGIKAYVGEVNALIARDNPDGIVIGYEKEEVSKTDGWLHDIHNDVIPIVVLPDLTYAFVGYHVEYLAGMPAFIVNQPNFSTMNIMTKRLFDFTSSLLGLIVFSPILTAIAIGVKLSSPGPIFYGQERVGLDGKKFKMWKFRSMRVSGDAPGWTVKDDPRKTKFGAFIRATSIDELPQLWNVVVGDMSLVGPRPEQPFYVEKFRSEIPAYMLRHKMKSGITGWAQVNGWRGDTSLTKRIECDLYYIRNWSLWLDVKILFLTIWKGFVNKNAY